MCPVKDTLFSRHAAGLGGFQHFQSEIETLLCSTCVPSPRLGLVTENCPSPDSGDARWNERISLCLRHLHFRGVHTDGGHLRTWQEALASQEEMPREKANRQHLDGGLSASRMVRNAFLLPKPMSLWCFLMAAPADWDRETGSHGLRRLVREAKPTHMCSLFLSLLFPASHNQTLEGMVSGQRTSGRDGFPRVHVTVDTQTCNTGDEGLQGSFADWLSGRRSPAAGTWGSEGKRSSYIHTHPSSLPATCVLASWPLLRSLTWIQFRDMCFTVILLIPVWNLAKKYDPI